MADWYIDVGTTKVCSLLADVSDREHIKVLGFGNTSSEGMRKGVVDSPERVIDSIERSLEQAWRRDLAIPWPRHTFVSITGSHVRSANNAGEISFNTAVVVSERYRLPVLERARSVAVSRERMVLHYITRNYILDGEVPVKSFPSRMRAKKLGAELHIITSEEAPVRRLMECLRGVRVNGRGIDLRGLHLVANPLASAEAVLTPEERDNGVILADIGGGTTDIAVFRGGEIWHTAVLPVGGYQITSDIVQGLNIHASVAEQIKIRHGDVTPGLAEKPSPIPETAGDRHTILDADLHNILRARVEELIERIMVEIFGKDYRRVAAELVPAGLVLTGGTANLPGIAAVGRDMLGLEVRVGRPNLGGVFGYGIKEDLDEPSFATVVGLLRFATNYQTVADTLMRRTVAYEVPVERELIEERRGVVARVLGFFRRIWRLFPWGRGGVATP